MHHHTSNTLKKLRTDSGTGAQARAAAHRFLAPTATLCSEAARLPSLGFHTMLKDASRDD